MKRRNFTKALIAVSLAPLIPAPVYADGGTFKVGPHGGARIVDINPGPSVVHRVWVDGMKVDVDLDQAESWKLRREFCDDWFATEVRARIDTYEAVFTDNFRPPAFPRWFNADIRGNNDLHLFSEREGLDVVATCVRITTIDESPNIRGQLRLVAFSTTRL